MGHFVFVFASFDDIVNFACQKYSLGEEIHNSYAFILVNVRLNM